jgi:hypothetical protein
MESYRRQKAKSRQRQYIIIAAVVVVVIVLAAYILQSQPAVYPARTPTPPLDNVPTIGGGNLAEHYHVHLDIYLNGSHINIPQDLGHVSDDTEYYALHTHFGDTMGVIHIEAPVAQDFTLSQVFAVWGWTLDSNHIFDKTGPITMYVNNGVTPRQFDTGYVLHSGDEIVLVYGTPPDSNPSSISWPYNPCVLACR